MSNRIILNNYSSGSFGNIFKDSQLNVYKFTVISKVGLLTVTNINELIFLNYFTKIKKIILNNNKNNKVCEDVIYDNSDDNTICDDESQFTNLIICDIPSYESILNDNIFMQSLSTNYYNESTFFNTYSFENKKIYFLYNSLLLGRPDKYVLVSKMPNYINNLYKLINKFHTYAISNFDVIAKKLLKSLAILHHNGFLHGDLKTANVLINDVDNMCLTDFGGIKIINFDAYLLSCTLTSRCPEDLKYDYNSNKFYNTNYKSDIWSLGLIFAEIILGFNPILNLYNQYTKIGMKNTLVEQKMMLYYGSIKYININKLMQITEDIKPYLNDNLYKKIQVIEDMLIVDHTKRLSTIEEVYEKMFDEKFEYNFTISYDYNYLKYNTDDVFDSLYLIRKKYYKDLINVCNKLHILFTCPLVIDIFDRILIKMIEKIKNGLSETNNTEFKILSCSIIILVSGIFNQRHPYYHQILNLFGITDNLLNIAYVNNNLLELLKLLDYDIIRPFNIFFCPYYLEIQPCLCTNKENFRDTYKKYSYIIHNDKEKDFFELILRKIINNNSIGLSPNDYYDKMKMYKEI